MKKYMISFVSMCQILLLSLCIGSIISFVPFGNVRSAYASERVAENAVELKKEAPSDLKELQAASDEQLDQWVHLQKFDGRSYDYVTPQKPQGSYQVCWAFAATGLAEISVLRQGLAPNYDKFTLDFDDLHVAWASKNMDKSSNPLNLMKDDVSNVSVDWNEGDSVYTALYSMTDGYSPILQQNDGQFKTNMASEFIAEQVIRVEPSREAIKKAILKYGGVAFSYEPGTYTNYMCRKASGTSHVSVIVGWDDNFDKDKHPFLPDKPDNNGAWVVKNSWSVEGADKVGDIGACYLSYEAHIGYRFAVDMGLKSDYPNIYQYDGSSVDSHASVSDIEANAAIFEAKLSDSTKQEYLKAIQVGFNAQDVDLQIEIYKLDSVNPGNVNDEINDPTKGKLLHKQSVRFAKDGFYIIPLQKEILLEQGEYFSIVLYDINGKNLKVICAVDATSTNDMTYYRVNNEWRSYKYSASFLYANRADINQTARIRAITDTRVRTVSESDKDLKFARIELANRLFLYRKGYTQTPQITVTLGAQTLQQGVDYRVEMENNIKPGTVKVTIRGLGDYHGTRITKFEIAKPYSPENLPGKEITVYKNTIRLHDIKLPYGWVWIEENQQLEEGKHEFNMKYGGEDKDYFINLYYGVIVNKLNEDPPDRISLNSADIVIDGTYTYTGSPIKPGVTVSLNGKILIEGMDYTISCTDNTNAGTAHVTISGIGLYKESRTQTFTIGKAQCPPNMPQAEMEASRKAATLSEIAHLLPTGWTWEAPQTPITDGMTANAVYEDKANYENHTATITVRQVSQVDIGSLNADYDRETETVYNGSPICPKVYIRDGNVLLTENVDFTVEYQNNTEVGEGKIIVTGTGDCYYGEITLTFSIKKADRNGFSVEIDDWTYSTSPATPTIHGENENGNVIYSYSSTRDGSYKNTRPTDAGTYWCRAEISASKNYNTAVAYKQFEIFKAEKPDIPSQLSDITVPSSAAHYRDIELPEHWTWKTPDVSLSESNTATIVYDDSRNYEQTEFVIKLHFESAPTEPANMDPVIYGVAGGIGGVSIVSVLAYVLIKRKRVL